MALAELVFKNCLCNTLPLTSGVMEMANGETQTSNVVGNPVGIKSCIDYSLSRGSRLTIDTLIEMGIAVLTQLRDSQFQWKHWVKRFNCSYYQQR